jgi:signal transduction histidine kinase
MVIAYSPQSRVERLIAVGRVFLSAFSLLAIFIDPSEPSRYAGTTYTLLALYLAYSLLLALLVWNTPDALVRFRLAAHVFDLASFTVFNYLTEAPNSPFFLYFIFSLLCGTLRWQWKGTLWTAVGALTMFLGLGGYAAQVLADPAFELNRFVIRAAYLVVVAILLGYLGAYEARTRRDISRLAGWTPATSEDLHEIVHQALEHAATVFRGQRLMVVWEDPDEPWVNVVCRTGQGLDWSRSRAGSLQPMVAAPLAELDFLVPNARARVPVALHNVPGGFRRWQGMPLHPELQARLDAVSVLALRLKGAVLDGRLLVLDLSRVSIDDLLLGEILARQVSTHLDHFYVLARLKEAFVDRERVSLARDLHDGLLQSLTGIALLLQTVPSMMGSGSEPARARLLEAQQLLAAHQRGLRRMIGRLEPMPRDVAEVQSSLGTAIEDLVTQIEMEWGVHVEVKTARLLTPVPESLLFHMVHLVREALVNAVRHGRASFIRVEVWTDDGKVHGTVADNGRGFPFRGRHDLAALTELKMGPITLKDRIASLDGNLIVESYESGASLEITLPLAPAPA